MEQQRNCTMERKEKHGKQRIEKEKEQKQSFIPYDIMYIILTKLPAKSLLRFRGVCKSWRAIISKPLFIKAHLNQSMKVNRQTLLYQPSYHTYNLSNNSWFFPSNYHEFLYVELSSTHDSNIFDYSKLNVQLNDELEIQAQPKPPKVYGCCNGLVLLSPLSNTYTSKCVVWNPSTRVQTELDCGICCDAFLLCGICYDACTDDYKVVLILRRPTTIDSNENNYMVFSFKSKAWRNRRSSRSFYHTCGTTVNIDGGFCFRSEGGRYDIVFFDAVEEEFEEVPPPPDCVDGFCLSEWKGCLGLCSGCEVWMMERKLWRKLFVIPGYVERRCLDSWSAKLICAERGEMVMVITDGDFIGIYNPRDSKYRELVTRNGIEMSSLESMFSPTIDLEAAEEKKGGST